MIRALSVLSALLISAPAFGQAHDRAGHGGADEEHLHAGEPAPDLGLPEDIRSALADGASLVTVDVLGMVCDFCATALTKTFGRRDAVAAVHVDLDAKTLSLALKAGAEMDDEAIARLAERAGYRIDAIRRGEGGGDAADAS
ncbi:MAG: hypothetical protein MI723_09380 [Caulobacterales bacterium]|nr:hypothetical protein [Caulobacterales bacterium]